MGHALQKAHRLLQPGGILIETHFTGEPPCVEVHRDGEASLAGAATRYDDFEAHRQAKAELDRAVRDGLFVPVTERFFDYLLYADSLDALYRRLSEHASSLVIDDEVAKQVEALVAAEDDESQVVLRRPTRIGRLRRADVVHTSG